MQISGFSIDNQRIADIVLNELVAQQITAGEEILYKAGQRYIKKLKHIKPGSDRILPLKDKGVYQMRKSSLG